MGLMSDTGMRKATRSARERFWEALRRFVAWEMGRMRAWPTPGSFGKSFCDPLGPVAVGFFGGFRPTRPGRL